MPAFGAVNVGSSSSLSYSFVFTFDTGGVGVSGAVLTLGQTGLDFGGFSNCFADTNYNPGESCNISVGFGPTLPGVRYGAATLSNASGAPIATGYVLGTGLGPQVNFSPGTESTLGSSFSLPHNVAVDGVGNVFVADSNNNAVKEIPAGGGTPITLGSGFSYPSGVVVDGKGHVFVADYGNNAVRELDFFDPPSLTFASTPVGSTSSDSPQTVTVTNVGNEPAVFIFYLWDSFPYVPTNFAVDTSGETACPLKSTWSEVSHQWSLPQSTSCLMPISFQPTTVGSLTGSLVLTHLAPESGGDYAFTQSISLSGIGIQTRATPTVTFTGAPASAAYGSTFNVAATTNASTSAVITGTPGICSVAGNTVTMTSGTGTCSLSANWAADSNYTSAAAGQSTVSMKAGSSTAITSNTPGTSSPGQAVLVSFQVTANGLPSGSVTVIARTGENCVGTLNSSVGGCSLSFATVGSRTLRASYTGDPNFNGSTSPAVTQSVIGPLASVSPSSIDFGTVYLGTITTKNVTVTNLGNAPMTITGPLLSIVKGGNSNEFIAVNACPKSLAAGRSCTISLEFVAGPFYNPQTAALSVVDNAPGSPQTVTLTATVINPQAQLSATSLNFDKQKVNTSSASKAVTLTNTGATTLTTISIAIAGINHLDFLETNNCPSSLTAKSTCTINVTFKPTATGSRSASIVITDNAQNSPQSISLSGTGN